MLKSRLWRSLDEAIRSAPGPLQAAIPRVRRAVLMVRYGHDSQARQELTALHQLYFQHPQRELGAWLHFAEGVAHYFSDFGACDRDRLEKAANMAAGCGDLELQALCSAWLCWFSVVRQDIRGSVAHALAAAALAPPDHHAARGRLTLALAIAHDFNGSAALAQAWYAQARQHVLAQGDDVGQSALIYNSAAMRVAQARRDSLGGLSPARPEQMLGAESVQHYDAAKHVTLLPELAPLLRAQLLVVAGDYEAAHALYAQHLLTGDSPGLTRFSGSLLADVAWCRVQLGQRDLAMQQAEAAELESAAEIAVDDRAITWGRLVQVYSALGLTERAEQAAKHARAEMDAYQRQQRDWAQALADAGLLTP